MIVSLRKLQKIVYFSDGEMSKREEKEGKKVRDGEEKFAVNLGGAKLMFDKRVRLNRMTDCDDREDMIITIKRVVKGIPRTVMD